MSMRAARLSLLLLALSLTTGCALLRPRVECTTHGGRSWHRIETAHFRIVTDSDLSTARATARLLENYRRALMLPLQLTTEPPGRLDVVLVRSASAFAEFFSDDLIGVMVSADAWRLMVLTERDTEKGISTLVAHELVHALSRRVLLRQPRWVAEGLARDLENLELEPDGTKAYVGKVPKWARTFGVDTRYLLTLEALWRWDESRPTGNALALHYDSAWAWTVFLRNRYGPQHLAFYQALMRAQEPRQAFAQAFPRVPVEQLDRELREYFDKGLSYFQTYALPPLEVPVRDAGALSDADVHVLRARLWLAADDTIAEGQETERARGELEKALALDPGNLDAAVLDVQLFPESSDRQKRAQALVARAPGSGQAFLELARALPKADTTGREAALRKAVTLAPDDSASLNTLAWELISRGRAQEAEPHALRAVSIAPDSPAYTDTLAAVRFGIGRCQEAIAMQLRAMEMLPDSTPDATRANYAERLKHYQSNCAPGK